MAKMYKNLFDIKMFCFLFLTNFGLYGQPLKWANKFGPNVSTLSGIHCIQPALWVIALRRLGITGMNQADFFYECIYTFTKFIVEKGKCIT